MSKETVSEETVGTDKETPAAEAGVAISPRTGKPIQKKYSPKKKGKPRGGNSPVIGNNGLMVEPGDNAKYLSLNMELFNMPLWASVRLCGGVLWRWCTLYRVRA